MNIGFSSVALRKLGFAVLVLAVAGVAAWQYFHGDRVTASQPLSAGPMVQNATSNGFTVVWWRPGGAPGDLQVRRGANIQATCPAAQNGTRYEARVTGLAPGTSYCYEIMESQANGSRRSLYVGNARTAPLPHTLFSFLVFGDSGSGNRFQYQLAQVMDRHHCDLILHAGDLVYGETSPADYDRKFFRPYRNLLSEVPLYPVLGNHDFQAGGGQPFLEKFSLPTNGPAAIPGQRCYWFDYGDARFVGIDSNLDPETLTGTVAPWLRDVLLAAETRWKFVFFHSPPWSGGRHLADENIRTCLVPAIEEGGANVVFCGHNHLYERTYPLRNGQIVAPTNGVVYITTGAGGKSLYKEKFGVSPHLAFYNNTQFSFTWVHVDIDRVEIEQIGANDVVLDRTVLKRPARPSA